MILANRKRREGREVKFTKSQLRTIRSFESDARKAEAELPKLIAVLPSIHLLLKTALESERTAMQLDEAVWKGMHPEDEALTKPLLGMRAANVAEVEGFLSRNKAQ